MTKIFFFASQMISIFIFSFNLYSIDGTSLNGYVKEPTVFPLNQFLKDSVEVKGKHEPLRKFKKDKITILFFWATWCPPCKTETALLVPEYKKYKKRGVRVIGINKDGDALETEKIKSLIKEYEEIYKISWPQIDARSVSNKEYFKNMHIELNPYKIVLDEKNRVRFLNPYVEEMEEVIEFLLEEQGNNK